MRFGFFISLLFHGVILMFAVVTLPNAWRADDELTILPVDLLSIDEITNVAAKVEKKPPELEEIAELKPKPVTAQKEQQAPPPPKVIAPAKDALPPLPDPKKKPEKKPEPKAEERTEVTQLAKAKPRKKPSPPTPKRQEKDFNLDQIAALLDKKEKEDPKPQPKQEDPLDDFLNSLEVDEAPRQATGLGTGLTMSELDAIRQHIRTCWRVPAGAANPEELVVDIRIQLNKDGTLTTPPQVTKTGASSFNRNSFSQAAADAAVRAVQRCQPYDFLPTDKYERWNDITFTFNPAPMIGR